jgi:site-specific DNA-methyltransferase (adenine-specific)/adenine-specific DNA-methyltransferase
MPTLNWIGKDAVIRHHKEVPFRLLEADAGLSHGGGAGNLIVQGDNLHALKALLPKYAGKVKCIYIDPPYNTGNEGWVYNDKVNSPEINRWLGSVVGKEAEDLSRHDKWLCMMYPRMVLLKQFLSEDGAIFVNLDDNEAATCRLLMDEIFGRANNLAVISWEKRYTRSNNARMFYSLKDTILVYRKSSALDYLREGRTEKADSIYANPDGDPRGDWTSSSYVNPATKEQRTNLVYTIINPNTGADVDHPTHAWKYEEAQHNVHVAEKRLWWGSNGNAKYPRLKVFKTSTDGGMVPVDLWKHEDTGTTDAGGNELKEIFGSAVFDNPKPTRLIQRILQIASDKDSIILDSFAGSGTTGHAVLKQNAEDGGTRKFILVEMEGKIAREITAERVRRVAGGYTNAKSEEVAGLGGGFQFCTLSEEPLFNEFGDIREDVRFAQLADFVWFAETGEGYMEKGIASPLHKPGEVGSRSSAKGTESPSPYSPLLGVKGGTAVYLLFNGILGDRRPQGGNILTQAVLDGLPEHKGPKVIYAAATRLGPAALQRAGIVFKQTPYAIEV